MRTLACWKAGVSGLARDQFEVGKPIKQFRWFALPCVGGLVHS